MRSQRAPRVSVIIPTYNRAALLCEAIDSALAQTYKDLEILVIDDGSTDTTAAAVRRRYGTESRVRYARRENGGVAAAQNTGLQLARGEFIGLLGDDDLWHADKLAHQVMALDRHPEAALCFSDMTIAGGTDDGRRFFEITEFDGRISLAGLVRHNFVPAAAALIRRPCLLAVGGFDETLTRAEDLDLWIRLLATYPAVCVDRVVGVYRRHPVPQLCDDKADLHNCIVRVLRKNRDLLLTRTVLPAGRRRWMDLVERAIRRHEAIDFSHRVKDRLARAPQASRAELLRLAAAAIRQEPWRPRHHRRYLVLALLGPRLAAALYGRRSRARPAVPHATGAMPVTHPMR